MRLKRSSIVISICSLVWITLMYYMFVGRIELVSEDLTPQIIKLEEGIQVQAQIHQDIIGEVHTILEHKKMSKQKSRNVVKTTVIPVLVFACNRVSVSRCLDQLIKYRPNPDQFPIIVSQDCDHPDTTQIIEGYGSQVTLIRQPDQTDIEVKHSEEKFRGYFKIARHYGWALNQTFFNFNFDAVIIVEDDLDIAPDFFEYFTATYPLLEEDETLWCISAWNDNGKEKLINFGKPELLYRTDFFPGLGWMLTKKVWTELCKKWPRGYWDDWIRMPEQRKERSCIRPEISRTKTFGKIGVSNGMYFEKHLKYIKLNEQFVPFTKMDLRYLIKDTYDKDFIKTVNQSPVVNYADLMMNNIDYDGPVRVIYRSKDAFKHTAKKFGLMDDFRSGVPRMAYQGIVTFFLNQHTVFLAPNQNWKGYDPSWN